MLALRDKNRLKLIEVLRGWKRSRGGERGGGGDGGGDGGGRWNKIKTIQDGRGRERGGEMRGMMVAVVVVKEREENRADWKIGR